MTDAYRQAYESFKWDIPERFNIGVDISDKWARQDPDRIAIIEVYDSGRREFSFSELAERSNQLANLLVERGLNPGDRVAVLAPQRFETVVAHAAIYKAGAIAVPLFSLFGIDALLHRLSDSGARFILTDIAGRTKIEGLHDKLLTLESVICFDGHNANGHSFQEVLGQQNRIFEAFDTRAEDPAIIIYTSGTTGSAKGALHAHRVLLGHLPGVEMSHGGFPQPGDRIWTPADWAWIGGLLDVLLPALHHGITVVARRFAKFDAAAAFQLIEDCAIRNVFLPPTALKMMRMEISPASRWRIDLRSVASGGESLGGELVSWVRSELGADLMEFYGQTECNMTVSSCSPWFSAKPGAIGKPVPGHIIAIVDDDGAVVPIGTEGNIAVLAPDPVMFLGYWNNPDATTEKFIGNWLVTGDIGRIDEDEFVHFVGRADDVITSAGYRIGPGEIEDCLLRHPAVLSAGVIGVPDALRTEAVTAFVILRTGIAPSDELAKVLQAHVRANMGGHQYPRAVFFLDELPLTVTGKIIRGELRRMAIEQKSET